MKNLHPRAFWLFFIRPLFSLVIFGIFLAIFAGGLVITVFNNLPIAIGLGIFLFFILIIFAFVWAKLTYNFYKYDLTENGLQKEYGVILKKYITIPYERIQNINLSQSIMERILGLYDVAIQTAGMSTGYGRFGAARAEGILPGLSREEAERLKNELIRGSRSQNQPQGL